MGILRALPQRIAMTELMPFVVALLCMLGQVTGSNSCGVDARPHAKGICGDNLLRARENLCFILYTNYPEHFGRSMNKRSATSLDAIPLHTFAKMTLPGQDAVSEMRETSASVDNMRKLYQSLFPAVRALLPDMGRSLPQAPASLSGPWHAKRASSSDSGPQIQKRGMVCDCCFNQCRPSVLARYC